MRQAPPAGSSAGRGRRRAELVFAAPFPVPTGSCRAAAALRAAAANAPAPAAAVGSASACPSAARRNSPATRSERAQTARWRGLCSFGRSFGNSPQRALEILRYLLERQRQGGAPSDQHIIMAAGKTSCGRKPHDFLDAAAYPIAVDHRSNVSLYGK